MMSKERRKRYQKRRQLRLWPETLRGMKESREAIATLQSLWPAAFPDRSYRVRPLASGIIAAIAERTGWDRSYARGVVQVWKARDAYCQAVLRYGRRFDLNGEPVEQTVSEEAREQARRRLAARTARMQARREETKAQPPEFSPGDVTSGAHKETAEAAVAS
jgi:sRNA-binding protein